MTACLLAFADAFEWLTASRLPLLMPRTIFQA